MNKAIIFCRVSSKEQEETGYSLSAQQKLLNDYTQKLDLPISRTFSISESASGSKQRNVFNEMLSYLEKEHIKILVVEKTDRLTRNIKDAVAINEWIEKDPERQVHFVKENVVLHKNSRSNEKFIWNIKVSVAQYYIDNLSEEVKKGQKEKLSQGWLPTKPPLGYKTVGEKGKRIHVIDEIRQSHATKMFEYYGSGLYSLTKLASQLSEEGLRSESGKRVPRSRIHGYLRDTFYIGLNRWNGKTTIGNQETFIPKELFEKVQNILTGKNTPKYSKHDYLFKGLFKCNECGGTITWETQKGIVYGHCNHYRDCSQATWVKQPDIEDQLITCFAKLEIKNTRLMEWIRKALAESHKEETEQYKQSVEDLNNRELQIKTRLSKLYDDRLDGKIATDFYETKFAEYTKERDEITSHKQRHNSADTKYYESVSALYDISQRAKEKYRGANLETKRKLLNLVYSKLMLDEGNILYTYTEPFRVLSEAIDTTNSSKEMEKANLLGESFEPEEMLGVPSLKSLSDGTCPIWLPLVDMFSNREIEFQYVFSDLKARCELLNVVVS